jgi:protein-disulfide isomerase
VNTQARNLFLAALVVIALIGVALIFVVRGPTPPTSSVGGAGVDKTFKVTIKGQTADIIGKPFTGDAVGQVRYGLGKADARLTVVEFSDYECPFCKMFSQETETQFISEFVDTKKVRFVFRDLPLKQHPNAFPAATAAACANDQSKFWEMHRLLFRAQDEWAALSSTAVQDKYADYANQLGLDGAALKACMVSNKHDATIRADADAGYALKIGGTPSFLINGYRYDAALPIEALRAILKDAGVE